MNIIQNLTTINRTVYSNRKIEKIVWHYFGALGSAEDTCAYFKNTNRRASAHYFIDDDGIWQCVEDKDASWHCGDGGIGTLKSICNNRNSIGIELRPYKRNTSTLSAADTDWYISEKTIANAIELTKMLMLKYGLSEEDVVRHYDVTAKWCPRPFMGDDINTYYETTGNDMWAKIKSRLTEKVDDIEMTKEELLSVAGTGDIPSVWAKEATEKMKELGIFNGDGQGNFGWQQPITREAVAVILANVIEKFGL